MADQKLKPCPFCGSLPIIDEMKGRFGVGCGNYRDGVSCNGAVFLLQYKRKSAAIKAWNNREPDTTQELEGYKHLADGSAILVGKFMAENKALQARIDALMLEYCPDEMSDEQLKNWAAHQSTVAQKATS